MAHKDSSQTFLKYSLQGRDGMESQVHEGTSRYSIPSTKP